MRAWLPYLSSAVVHGGFLAALHCAWDAPLPQYALEAGDARIELVWTQPREATETPAVQVAPEEPQEHQPAEVPPERQAAEVPPPAPAEVTSPDLPAEVAVARASVEEPPPATSEETPAEPLERQALRVPVPATPAAFQPPAVAGASVDEMPQKLPRNPTPPYPAAAYTARQEGIVLVRVQVAATGLVADARLEESCGFALLDQSAVETVRQWRFSPARRAGAAVAHEILVPVRFQLAGRRPA